MTIKFIKENYPKLLDFFTQEWIEQELEKNPSKCHPVANQIHQNRELSSVHLEKLNRYLTVLEKEIAAKGSYRRRLTDNNQYYNTRAELEIGTMFKEMGFQIELEPSIPDSPKKSDIKIIHDENEIFIEIRTVKSKPGIPIQNEGDINIYQINFHSAVDIADKIGDEVHGLSDDNIGIVVLFLAPGFPNPDILPQSFYGGRLYYHDGKVVIAVPGGNAQENHEISGLFLYQQWRLLVLQTL